jgi:DNA-binding NtrC family response regulator
MNERISVLLVCDRLQGAEELRAALKETCADVSSVRTCEEVRRLIGETQPLVVFTGITLPDGTWKDVLNLAEHASAPPNVIVVNSTDNLRLYLEAIENGAFDFVVPPFDQEPVGFLAQTAAAAARWRRGPKVQTAAA